MRVALTLNQEEKEVTGEIWEYLEGLPGDLFTGQRVEARETAVKKLEDGSAAPVVAK